MNVQSIAAACAELWQDRMYRIQLAFYAALDVAMVVSALKLAS
jgi:hypothetical protein